MPAETISVLVCVAIAIAMLAVARLILQKMFLYVRRHESLLGAIDSIGRSRDLKEMVLKSYRRQFPESNLSRLYCISFYSGLVAIFAIPCLLVFFKLIS